MIVQTRTRRGFTLLEVLLSMAILLISIVAIGSLVEQSSNQSVIASLRASGTRLAQSKLAEVEAGALPISASGTGNFTYEPEWTWSVEPVSTGVPNVYSVTVRVYRDYRGLQIETVITQMIFDPAMMGDAAEAVPPETETEEPTS